MLASPSALQTAVRRAYRTCIARLRASAVPRPPVGEGRGDRGAEAIVREHSV